jgi:hypothetical protein
MKARSPKSETETELLARELKRWMFTTRWQMCLFIFFLLVFVVVLLDYLGVVTLSMVTELFRASRMTGFDVGLSGVIALMGFGSFMQDCMRVRRLRHTINEAEWEDMTGNDSKSLS